MHPAFWPILLLAGAATGHAVWRTWVCQSQLFTLRARLARVASGEVGQVDDAFALVSLEPLRIAWTSFRSGLHGRYSTPLAILSWTPELWSSSLLRSAEVAWVPVILLLGSPIVAWSGISAGWERWDKELATLTELQPWEGLRALDMVRHASHSFLSWAEPGVTAAVLAFGLAVALAACNWVARRWLKNSLETTRRQLLRLFPPQPQNSELADQLADIQKQLALLRELLNRTPVESTGSGSASA